MLSYRLFTENKNRDDVVRIVGMQFESFTLSESLGYWHGNPESTLIIEIIEEESPVIEARIIAVAAEIRRSNKQECVLLSSHHADRLFI